METYSARLERSGRILIPASVRHRLGLAEGSAVVVRVEESSGAIEIVSRSQALAKARKDLRKLIPPGRDLVEELIRDRRREVETDDAAAARK
jgi:AbrB family looped-hinge helix DNA binding protein